MSNKDGSYYDADYFLHGCQSGKSLYENYHWIPELTIPMACTMVAHLGITHSDTVLDFGCARGYTVRAFRELGYKAYGVDISKWAVDNCDATVRDFLLHSNGLPDEQFDWILSKDVLEHVPDASDKVTALMQSARKGVLAVVPLSNCDRGKYVVAAYEKDATHIHRLTLPTWVGMFVRPGWSVTASYRIRGIKDNYWRPKYERANGFIVAKRETWE